MSLSTDRPVAAPQSAFHEGLECLRTGAPARAVEWFRTALAAAPDAFDVHNNLAVALRRAGRASEAASLLEQAARRFPDRPELFINLARCQSDLGRLDQGRRTLLQAAARFPDDGAVWTALGRLEAGAGQARLAAGCLQRATALLPDYAEGWTLLGNQLLACGEGPAARCAYDAALALAPDDSAALTGKAQAFVSEGALTRAAPLIERALTARPDLVEAHLARARLAFLRGDHALGWQAFEWRWRLTGQSKPAFPMPEWQGQDPAGLTLFAWAEQGLGDTVQFLRYIPRLFEAGTHVILSVPPPVVDLAARSFPRCTVHSGPPPTAPPPDYHVPLGSLPLRLRCFEPPGCAFPYLRAARPPRPAADGTRRIGLVWRGNPRHANDLVRSMPVTQWLPLLGTSGCRFTSLQIGEAATDLARLPEALRPADGGRGLATLDDTADALGQLDLLVSVDTSVAHLAGALDVPVWMLLAHAPDWRWGLEHSATPWYRSARLFRQRTPGDWQGVVESVGRALAEWAPE